MQPMTIFDTHMPSFPLLTLAFEKNCSGLLFFLRSIATPDIFFCILISWGVLTLTVLAYPFWREWFPGWKSTVSIPITNVSAVTCFGSTPVVVGTRYAVVEDRYLLTGGKWQVLVPLLLYLTPCVLVFSK